MRLFGFEIRRPVADEVEEKIESFAPKETDDGAVVVSAGGVYGTYVDLEGSVKTEAELVTKYRDMALQSEIDMAIDDNVNEVIVYEDDTENIDINLDDIPVESEEVKDAIRSEFKNVLRLLEFDTRSYDIFRTWYVDGRLYYHVIVDPQNPLLGSIYLISRIPRRGF